MYRLNVDLSSKDEKKLIELCYYYDVSISQLIRGFLRSEYSKIEVKDIDADVIERIYKYL